MRIRYGSSSLSKWCDSVNTGLQTLQGFILSLQASTASVHGNPQLYFENLKVLNLDLNADPDPASKNNAD